MVCSSDVHHLPDMNTIDTDQDIRPEAEIVTLAPLRPYNFAIPRDQTPNLTTILITTDHYTPYPKYYPWSRLSHSLMAVRFMFAS